MARWIQSFLIRALSGRRLVCLKYAVVLTGSAPLKPADKPMSLAQQRLPSDHFVHDEIDFADSIRCIT